MENYLDKERLAWWVEIVTNFPPCIYYLGSFVCVKEALIYLPGYINDLEQEEAEVITINLKLDKPVELTIVDEELRDSYPPNNSKQVSPLFLKAIAVGVCSIPTYP